MFCAITFVNWLKDKSCPAALVVEVVGDSVAEQKQVIFLLFFFLKKNFACVFQQLHSQGMLFQNQQLSEIMSLGELAGDMGQ